MSTETNVRSWRRPITPLAQSPTLPYSVTQEEAEKDERNYDYLDSALLAL